MKIKNYIERIIQKRKPKKILICGIYFPSTTASFGWAEKQLEMLGYNTDPECLQLLIRYVFENFVSAVKIEGVEV